MPKKIHLVLSLFALSCGANVPSKAQPHTKVIKPLVKAEPNKSEPNRAESKQPEAKKQEQASRPIACPETNTYFEVTSARLGNDTALREFCVNPLPQAPQLSQSEVEAKDHLLVSTDLISGRCLHKNCSSPISSHPRVPLEPTVLRAIVEAATYKSISIGNMQKHYIEEDSSQITEQHEEVSKHKILFHLNKDTKCVSKNLLYNSEVFSELSKGAGANKTTTYHTDAHKFYQSLELDELFYTYYLKGNTYKIVMIVDVSYEAHGESLLFKEKTLCQSTKPIYLLDGYFNVYLTSRTPNQIEVSAHSNKR